MGFSTPQRPVDSEDKGSATFQAKAYCRAKMPDVAHTERKQANMKS